MIVSRALRAFLPYMIQIVIYGISLTLCLVNIEIAAKRRTGNRRQDTDVLLPSMEGKIRLETDR